MDFYLNEEDEAPRADASLEAMAKLPPLFVKDGSVTAGNAPGVNDGGAAVAFGHPIGATGARIVMNLIEVLRDKGGKYGVAAICSGAAQGDALLVRVD